MKDVGNGSMSSWLKSGKKELEKRFGNTRRVIQTNYKKSLNSFQYILEIVLNRICTSSFIQVLGEQRNMSKYYNAKKSS